MSGVTCRFFGGPYDGNVREVEEDLVAGYGVLKIPEPPQLDLVCNLSSVSTEPTYRVHTYIWDRTINDAGERRMRWSGEHPQ